MATKKPTSSPGGAHKTPATGPRRAAAGQTGPSAPPETPAPPSSDAPASGGDTPVSFQELAALAVRVLVAGTRFVLVPVAQTYARPPVDEEKSRDQPPPDALTPFEKASLSRAAQKLVVEAGGLLTANFSPVPPGTTYTQPTPDQNGSYGEPSLAGVVAGIRGWHASRQQKVQEEQDEAAALRPVTIRTLRSLRRG